MVNVIEASKIKEMPRKEDDNEDKNKKKESSIEKAARRTQDVERLKGLKERKEERREGKN